MPHVVAKHPPATIPQDGLWWSVGEIATMGPPKALTVSGGRPESLVGIPARQGRFGQVILGAGAGDRGDRS